MIIPSKFNGYTKDGIRRLYLGGGGGGGPTQTTSTVQNTNIPEYAKPYVETMLGATQKQLFQGTPTEGGGFDITGFKPYQAYGGTYDQQGNQTSYDPSKAVAGFQPMQETAQRGIAGMQVPGQYGQGMDITGAGVRGAFGTAGQARGLAGLGYEAAGAGDRYAMQATNPYATQAYMSPYMQNVVDVQNREAMRNAQIAGTQQQGEATRVGAFGGSRDAIMRAERERNLATLMNQNQAQGLQGAFQQAQQSQQFGANLGLQGMQAGMQGVGAGINAQQAAYNQAMQGGQQMANLGQQQLASQQGIYGLQNQFGGQQQALEQQKINQAMQDYANAQQYPLMQLGTMSNMLRGLPMQASTTNQYQAAPNQLSQAIGAVGSGASIYNAFKGASGGLPSEFKYAKGGGIMSYDMGGEIESQLEDMNEQQLAEQAKESSSPSIRRMAQRILRERQMSKQSEGASAMGIQYQAPQAQMPAMRGGGIIAFKTGGGANEEGGEDEAKIDMEKRLAMPAPTEGGIVGATTPPTTPVPFAPTAGRAVQQAAGIPDFLKAEYADAEKRMNAPLSTFMAERQTAMREAGVADAAEGQQQQRANLMAERASATDEKERQRHLRLAEFFANWGSTPGPTLVAGMNALKQAVPNIISDEKDAKKARKEIDKSIADLDNATRLEKRGEVDAAMALKLKAAEDMKALNAKMIDYQSRRESDAAGIKGHEISAKAQVEAAAIRAQQDKLNRAQAEVHKDEDRKFGQYQVATKQFELTRDAVAKAESQDAHKNDLKKLEQYTYGAKDKKTGEIDENKINKEYKAVYAETKKRVADRMKGWNEAIETAEKERDLAFSRLKGLKPEAAAARTKPKGTPTVSLDDPSLQRE
jgi:hypothetical protein